MWRCHLSNTKVSPLRVALVTGSYNFIADGVALTLNQLVGWLDSHDVVVKVFAPTAAKPALIHKGDLISVPSLPVPGRPEYRLTFGLGRDAKNQLLGFKPDLIHIATPDMLGLAALKLGKKHNIPIVASYHTRFETYLRHYWYLAGFENQVKRYLRWFYGQMFEVYVPSESVREVLLAEGLRDNFKLWPHGVDTALFSPNKHRDAWRRQYGISPNEIVVLHVSRLVREKRLDILTAALNRVKVPHRVVIVGAGPDRSFVEHALPHASFTGFLHGEELATAYASSDLFIFPSDSESFGIVTLEAMASGLACICADATGSRSLVIPGETGYLEPVDDVDGFACAITQLINDASLRHFMGKAARAKALTYSWEEAMERISGYYRRLLDV